MNDNDKRAAKLPFFCDNLVLSMPKYYRFNSIIGKYG